MPGEGESLARTCWLWCDLLRSIPKTAAVDILNISVPVSCDDGGSGDVNVDVVYSGLHTVNGGSSGGDNVHGGVIT